MRTPFALEKWLELSLMNDTVNLGSWPLGLPLQLTKVQQRHDPAATDHSGELRRLAARAFSLLLRQTLQTSVLVPMHSAIGL